MAQLLSIGKIYTLNSQSMENYFLSACRKCIVRLLVVLECRELTFLGAC